MDHCVWNKFIIVIITTTIIIVTVISISIICIGT